MVSNYRRKRSGAGAAPFSFVPGRFAVVVTALMALLGLGVTTSSTATAAATGPPANARIVNAANPVHGFRQASPTAEIVRVINPGTPVVVLCQDTGSMTSHGNIWDLILNPSGSGLDSFVLDYYVSTPNKGSFSPGFNRCGVLPPGAVTSPALTMEWRVAVASIGQTRAPDGVFWGGNCDHFAAYINGLASSGYASAHDHYLSLKRRGLIHTGSPPPWASLVFSDWIDPTTGKNLGHVAFSNGDGQIITTPSAPGQPVVKKPLSYMGRNVSWAWPAFFAS